MTYIFQLLCETAHSICLLEAMATGLYPIVSKINANTAWLKHRENGLLHEVSNPRNIADCIFNVLAHSDSVVNATKQNRTLVVEKGNRTKNMQNLGLFYEQLISKCKHNR